MTIHHFESPGDLSRACRKARDQGRASHHFANSANPWHGGESFTEAAIYAEKGNDAYVPEAEKMLDKISADLIDIPMPQWKADLCGAYPIVPDFLAGNPEPMRRRVNDISDRSPVRIYVCTTSSGGINATVLKRRGAAIMALVLALAPVRPVELYVFSILGSHSDGEAVTYVRLPSAPLHIGITANALCGQGWARGLCYGYSTLHQAANGRWPSRYRYGKDNTGYLRDLAARMGNTVDAALVIPPAELRDPIVKEPVRWINDRLAEYAALAPSQGA